MLEAATYCNYNTIEFDNLDFLERARVVAQYRMHNRIESHVQDAVNKAVKRGNNSRRAAASRRSSSSS